MPETIPIYPYISSEGLIQLVPLKNYEQLKKTCDALTVKRRDYFLAVQNAEAEAEQLRADVEELRSQRDEFKAAFAKSESELDVLLILIRRLHLAITARMSADEPTGQERLELLHAWKEAGKVLDGFASLVRPNDADRGQSPKNLQSQQPAPDHCKLWTDDQIRIAFAEIQAMRDELADIRERLKGHPDSKLDGENGLAAATMRGFDKFHAENEAMREAIKQVFSSFADEPASDSVWLLDDRQTAALAKLQPFIKP